MKNLLNFFFSFDKLFKEKLIVPAFWLALIYYGLKFLVEAIDAVELDPLNWIIGPVSFLAQVLFTLLAIRIVAELCVAIFRINNNLSPDKGVSELADIDPVAEARRAAEMAAARTREMTKTATDKTRTAIDDVKHSVEERADAIGARTGLSPKPAVEPEPLPVKALEPSAIDGAAVRKRGPGRPKGSKNKTTSDAPAAKSASTPTKRGPGRPKGSKNKTTSASAATATPAKKRGPGRPKGSKNKTTSSGTKPGPKKGQPIPRDKDGNLLKKDGTPRKKPGPKPKS